MAMHVALLALGVENAGPVWPLQGEVTRGVVDSPAPRQEWLSVSLGSSHAGIDALAAAAKEVDVSQLVFKCEVVDYETVEPEVPKVIESATAAHNTN